MNYIYQFEDKFPSLPESKDIWLANNSVLIGRVVLAEKVSIWYGAVLRGDNEEISVGHGSNIRENCVLHTDLGFPLNIGRNCTIGHSAILHGCSIGDNSLVGMGAIVLNGAIIEDNCLIGAGALIPEKKVIPSGSLVVGRPGKIVRMLSISEQAGLLKSALNYQEKADRFRKRLNLL